MRDPRYENMWGETPEEQEKRREWLRGVYDRATQPEQSPLPANNETQNNFGQSALNNDNNQFGQTAYQSSQDMNVMNNTNRVEENPFKAQASLSSAGTVPTGQLSNTVRNTILQNPADNSLAYKYPGNTFDKLKRVSSSIYDSIPYYNQAAGVKEGVVTGIGDMITGRGDGSFSGGYNRGYNKGYINSIKEYKDAQRVEIPVLDGIKAMDAKDWGDVGLTSLQGFERALDSASLGLYTSGADKIGLNYTGRKNQYLREAEQAGIGNLAKANDTTLEFIGSNVGGGKYLSKILPFKGISKPGKIFMGDVVGNGLTEVNHSGNLNDVEEKFSTGMLNSPYVQIMRYFSGS